MESSCSISNTTVRDVSIELFNRKQSPTGYSYIYTFQFNRCSDICDWTLSNRKYQTFQNKLSTIWRLASLYTHPTKLQYHYFNWNSPDVSVYRVSFATFMLTCFNCMCFLMCFCQTLEAQSNAFFKRLTFSFEQVISRS